MYRLVTVVMAVVAVTSSSAGASSRGEAVAGTDAKLAKSLLLKKSDRLLNDGFKAYAAGGSSGTAAGIDDVIGPCRGAVGGGSSASNGTVFISEAYGLLIVSGADVYAGTTAARRAASRSRTFFRCLREMAVGTRVTRVVAGSREQVTYTKIGTPPLSKRAANSIDGFDTTLAVSRPGQKRTIYLQWIEMRYGRVILRLMISSGEAVKRSDAREVARFFGEVLNERAGRADTG